MANSDAIMRFGLQRVGVTVVTSAAAAATSGGDSVGGGGGGGGDDDDGAIVGKTLLHNFRKYFLFLI
jgi:hypothetical protein